MKREIKTLVDDGLAALDESGETIQRPGGKSTPTDQETGFLVFEGCYRSAGFIDAVCHDGAGVQQFRN
jgi:hypothetical protein